MQYIEYVPSKERELLMSEEFTINVQNSEFTISVDGDTVYTVELGATGARGKAGTITVGEVTSIDTFADPTVVNVGTIEDAIFDFGIPRGKGFAEGTGIDIVDVDDVQTISVDKTELALDQVDNTSDANKPISTATATALGDKVDKVAGKGLSTNDLTDILKGNYDTAYTNTHTHSNKTVLDAIQESLTTTLKSNYDTAYSHSQTTGNPHNTTPTNIGLGNVNNTSDANKPVSTAQQTALNLKADATALSSHTGNTSNPHSVTKSQVGLGNCDNTSDANKPISTATQTALNDKVTKNTAITGATKTKITYDAKGLVTAGVDATTADIADSLNKRYVTDAQFTVIGNTSNTNTGDETNATIKTKLGVVSASNEGYVTPTQKATWDTASGTAGKVLVSATDTTSDYLTNKISGGYGITLTTTNAGANEVKSISMNQSLSGTCSTASATSAKTVTISGFSLVSGAKVLVTFSNKNTVTTPTLNVNSTGAKPIAYESGLVGAFNYAYFPSGYPIEFVYDGTNWIFANKVVYAVINDIEKKMVYANGWIELGFKSSTAIASGGNVSTSWSIPFMNTPQQITLTPQVATDVNGSGAPSLCCGASTSNTALYIVNEGDRAVIGFWMEAKGY